MENEWNLDRAKAWGSKNPRATAIARLILTQSRMIPQEERLDRRDQFLSGTPPEDEKLREIWDFEYYVVELTDNDLDSLIKLLPEID